MSTEPTTVTPSVKKKDKLFGMDNEDIALGLGGAALLGVAILGFLKLQDMNVLPKPQSQPVPQSRVTIGPPPENVALPPPQPQQAAPTGVVERDPLGPNTNSVPMDFGDHDGYIDQERLAKSRTSMDRINVGY